MNYITFDLTNCTCKLYKSNVTERSQICPTNNVSLMRKNATCFVLCIPPLIRLLSPPHISAFSLGTPETLAFPQTVTSASGVCNAVCALEWTDDLFPLRPPPPSPGTASRPPWTWLDMVLEFWAGWREAGAVLTVTGLCHHHQNEISSQRHRDL